MNLYRKIWFRSVHTGLVAPREQALTMTLTELNNKFIESFGSAAKRLAKSLVSRIFFFQWTEALRDDAQKFPDFSAHQTD